MMSTQRTLVVTGADASHADLLLDFIDSYRAAYGQRHPVALVAFSQGVAQGDAAEKFDVIRECCDGQETFDKSTGYFAAFTSVKARLPELFPGYDVLIWIDADCWFSSADSIERIRQGALLADIAIHPEYDVHYLSHPTPHPRTVKLYRQNYEGDTRRLPVTKPMLNAGVFGMRATSPVWARWAEELERLRSRRRAGRDVYFTDQIPLHKLIYEGGFRIFPLRAVDNWQAYASLPLVTVPQAGHPRLFVPSPPFEPIGILHLAGDAKSRQFQHRDGCRTTLRYADLRRLAADAAPADLEDMLMSALLQNPLASWGSGTVEEAEEVESGRQLLLFVRKTLRAAVRPDSWRGRTPKDVLKALATQFRSYLSGDPY